MCSAYFFCLIHYCLKECFYEKGIKGIGNTTGSTGASIKNLNKIGYLETEWYAKNGLLAAGKGGGLSYTDLDVAYFK